MVFSLVFTLLALSAVSCAVKVPVYMFGDIAESALKYSPLTTVQKEEFSDILKEELVNDPFTVIFIEETLSVEDLSLKNVHGESVFPFLRTKVRGSAYMPSVENAIQALNYLADPEKVDHVKLTDNGLSAEIKPGSKKFLFINLTDAKEGESRADLLRRHNDFMEVMFNKLQQRYNKVAAIYTARFPSWTVPEAHSVERRQASGRQNKKRPPFRYSHYNITGFLMTVGEMILVVNWQRMNLRNGATKMLVRTDRRLRVELKFDYNRDGRYYYLVYEMRQTAGYWIMHNVMVTKDEDPLVEWIPPEREVGALVGFAYRCAIVLNFSKRRQTWPVNVTLTDLKVQPFFRGYDTKQRIQVYGDSLNCIESFTVPIWACLFIAFFLLAITLCGLMMIMDIRTNDRFDDLRKRRITINTTD